MPTHISIQPNSQSGTLALGTNCYYVLWLHKLYIKSHFLNHTLVMIWPESMVIISIILKDEQGLISAGCQYRKTITTTWDIVQHHQRQSYPFQHLRHIVQPTSQGQTSRLPCSTKEKEIKEYWDVLPSNKNPVLVYQRFIYRALQTGTQTSRYEFYSYISASWLWSIGDPRWLGPAGNHGFPFPWHDSIRGLRPSKGVVQVDLDEFRGRLIPDRIQGWDRVKYALSQLRVGSETDRVNFGFKVWVNFRPVKNQIGYKYTSGQISFGFL